MTYQKLNNGVGWSVWALATVVFLSTIEPTASFWDCGEFIASAYKLEVGHPPGAPFFMLLARLLMIFSTPETAAVFANALSALSSSFTILFLFWSVTHLSKKLIQRESDSLTKAEMWAVFGSGAVGALAYTFSDSFWFSGGRRRGVRTVFVVYGIGVLGNSEVGKMSRTSRGTCVGF